MLPNDDGGRALRVRRVRLEPVLGLFKVAVVGKRERDASVFRVEEGAIVVHRVGETLFPRGAMASAKALYERRRGCCRPIQRWGRTMRPRLGLDRAPELTRTSPVRPLVGLASR